MSVKCEKFMVATKGFNDTIDITPKIQDIAIGIQEDCALINVAVKSSTASIINVEYEPGIVIDISQLFEELIPINKVYKHDILWNDSNANAHLKSILLGNNITLNCFNKRLELNSKQKIMLVDFDSKMTNREIIVTITT